MEDIRYVAKHVHEVYTYDKDGRSLLWGRLNDYHFYRVQVHCDAFRYSYDEIRVTGKVSDIIRDLPECNYVCLVVTGEVPPTYVNVIVLNYADLAKNNFEGLDIFDTLDAQFVFTDVDWNNRNNIIPFLSYFFVPFNTVGVGSRTPIMWIEDVITSDDFLGNIDLEYCIDDNVLFSYAFENLVGGISGKYPSIDISAGDKERYPRVLVKISGKHINNIIFVLRYNTNHLGYSGSVRYALCTLPLVNELVRDKYFTERNVMEYLSGVVDFYEIDLTKNVSYNTRSTVTHKEVGPSNYNPNEIPDGDGPLPILSGLANFGNDS